MSESLIKGLPESEPLLTLNKNVFHMLMLTVLCCFLAWYAQYLWKRRKLYQIAAQTKGPLALPFIGNALNLLGSSDELLNIFLRLTKEYESPARLWFGQQLFFIIHKAKDLEIILNSPYALEKIEMFRFLKALSGNGLLAAPVPKWKRHRRIIMPTLNQKILDEYVEIFSEQSEVLVQQLQKEAGKGIFNAFPYLSRCSVDIVCETIMGTKGKAQTTESDYYKWATIAMQIVIRRMGNVFLHSDFVFNRTSMAKELYDVTNKMNEFTAAVVRAKKREYFEKLKENKEQPEVLCEKEPRQRKSFLELLIALSEEGATLTDQDLLDEVKVFMLAGSDTTASTEGFVFIMLGMFPDMQKTVYQEVIDILGPDRPVEREDLGKLPYMERFIKETMRVLPNGALFSRRVTGDIKLDKVTIPAGSSVTMNILSTHRDPDVYPNPLKFDPDRFLPEEVAKRHSYTWLPFSGGPRNCVGIKFSMMAMKTVIATVIRKYRFCTDYKSIEDIKLKLDVILKPVDGYRVSLELRE